MFQSNSLRKNSLARIKIASSGELEIDIEDARLSDVTEQWDSCIYIYGTQLEDISFVKYSVQLLKSGKNFPQYGHYFTPFISEDDANNSGRVLLAKLINGLNSNSHSLNSASSYSSVYDIQDMSGSACVTSPNVADKHITLVPRFTIENIGGASYNTLVEIYRVYELELSGKKIVNGWLTPLGRAFTSEINLNSISSIHEWLLAYLVCAHPHSTYLLCVGDKELASRVLGVGLSNWRLAIANKVFGYQPKFPHVMASLCSYFSKETNINFEKIYNTVFTQAPTYCAASEYVNVLRSLPFTRMESSLGGTMSDIEILGRDILHSLRVLNTRLASSCYSPYPNTGFLKTRYSDNTSYEKRAEWCMGPESLLCIIDSPTEVIEQALSKFKIDVPAKTKAVVKEIVDLKTPVDEATILGESILCLESAYANYVVLLESNILGYLTEDVDLSIKPLFQRGIARKAILDSIQYDLKAMAVKIDMASGNIDSTINLRIGEGILSRFSGSSNTLKDEISQACRKRASNIIELYSTMQPTDMLYCWRFKEASAIDSMRCNNTLREISSYGAGFDLSNNILRGNRNEVGMLLLYELLTGGVKKSQYEISPESLSMFYANKNIDSNDVHKWCILDIYASYKSAKACYQISKMYSHASSYKPAAYLKRSEGMLEHIIVSPYFVASKHIKSAGFNVNTATYGANTVTTSSGSYGIHGMLLNSQHNTPAYPLDLDLHNKWLPTVAIQFQIVGGSSVDINILELQKASAAAYIAKIALVYSDLDGLSSIVTVPALNDLKGGYSLNNTFSNIEASASVRELNKKVLFVLSNRAALFSNSLKGVSQKGSGYNYDIYVDCQTLVYCLDILKTKKELIRICSGLNVPHTGINESFIEIIDFVDMLLEDSASHSPILEKTIYAVREFFSSK